MSSSAAWSLGWALIMVLVVYVIAVGSKRIWAIGALLVLIPFQAVETRYASSSVLMTYALGVVLLVNGGLRVRMMPALGFIVLAYLVSLTQANRDFVMLHVLLVFEFFSCLVVFLLAYNFARLVESERTIVSLLLVMNVLVIVYCAVQFTVGPGEQFVPFGIEELAFNKNRDPGDPRMIGPFENPGTTAGYFMLMTLVCAVETMFARDRRLRLVQLVIGLNLLCLVATANRGAFLVLLVMFPAVLITFRERLGARRIAQYLVGGLAVLAIASTIAVMYTDFGKMFDRLETITETEDGVPSTRALTWPVAVAKIKLHPWLGEGPYFVHPETAEQLGLVRSDYDNYPHNLYLYLLRTVGVVGLVAVVGFFVQAWWLLHRSLRRPAADEYQAAILRLGLLLIAAFLVDEIKLEFNRPSTIDYAHFVFALIGLLIGACDRVERASSLPAEAQSIQAIGRQDVRTADLRNSYHSGTGGRS
jgi:O-antigen ligase